MERGGRDGRSSSGYSQEQPCKRSKDGGEERVGDGRQGRAEGKVRGGDGVTTPYSHDGLVGLATQDGRKKTGGRKSGLWVEVEIDLPVSQED